MPHKLCAVGANPVLYDPSAHLLLLVLIWAPGAAKNHQFLLVGFGFQPWRSDPQISSIPVLIAGIKTQLCFCTTAFHRPQKGFFWCLGANGNSPFTLSVHLKITGSHGIIESSRKHQGVSTSAISQALNLSLWHWVGASRNLVQTHRPEKKNTSPYLGRDFFLTFTASRFQLCNFFFEAYITLPKNQAWLKETQQNLSCIPHFNPWKVPSLVHGGLTMSHRCESWNQLKFATWTTWTSITRFLDS